MYGFPSLPLMEGIVGFAVMGGVLVSLSTLERMGLITVSEKVINGCLVVGSIIGLCVIIFKLKYLVSI